ncbi:DUF4352 domain-containing protein [Streptomyces niveus]|uniref:DUF4352 domain-containing protein n=1 Tax=Streptomyces niveus TaxID=193462 RepID=UPI0033B194CD
MRPGYASALAVALLLPLTACGGSEAKTEAKASEKTPVATPTETATQEPAELKIGAASAWETDLDGYTATGKTTVINYEQPAKGTSSPGEGLGLADPEWAVVEVKVCNAGPDSISVSQMPWSLRFPDDSRVDTTGLNGGDLPKPEFPTDDTIVKADDCLRGKIPFAVERGVRPDRIVYAPSASAPVEWSVSAV